jgi:hypothetical protein
MKLLGKSFTDEERQIADYAQRRGFAQPSL